MNCWVFRLVGDPGLFPGPPVPLRPIGNSRSGPGVYCPLVCMAVPRPRAALSGCKPNV